MDDDNPATLAFGAVTVRALPIVLFFARYPDEELFTSDCALKLQADPQRVRRILDVTCQRGVLARSGGQRGAAQHTYRAGPVLLRMIGLDAQADTPTACLPQP